MYWYCVWSFLPDKYLDGSIVKTRIRLFVLIIQPVVKTVVFLHDMPRILIILDNVVMITMVLLLRVVVMVLFVMLGKIKTTARRNRIATLIDQILQVISFMISLGINCAEFQMTQQECTDFQSPMQQISNWRIIHHMVL